MGERGDRGDGGDSGQITSFFRCTSHLCQQGAFGRAFRCPCWGPLVITDQAENRGVTEQHGGTSGGTFILNNYKPQCIQCFRYPM